jgi:hypothetical protein
MHETWDNIEQIDVNYHHGHLWVQITFSGEERVLNLFAAGDFSMHASNGRNFKKCETINFSESQPGCVIYFRTDAPPFTTLKIFNAKKKMIFHVKGTTPLQKT